MIKKTLRSIILFSLSLYLVSLFWGNINFSQNLSILLQASLVLTIFENLIKPIIKLLLLPITLVTLGLVRLFINVLGLYLVEYFITSFQISDISTLPQNWLGLSIPAINVYNFWAYLVTSFTINIVYNVLNKILVKVKKVKI